MQAGSEWRADFEQSCFAGHVRHANGGATAIEAWGHKHGNGGGRSVDRARRHIADGDLRKVRLVDREPGSVNGDPATLYGPMRLNRGKTRQTVRFRRARRSNRGS